MFSKIYMYISIYMLLYVCMYSLYIIVQIIYIGQMWLVNRQTTAKGLLVFLDVPRHNWRFICICSDSWVCLKYTLIIISTYEHVVLRPECHYSSLQSHRTEKCQKTVPVILHFTLLPILASPLFVRTPNFINYWGHCFQIATIVIVDFIW